MQWLKNLIIGKARNVSDGRLFQNISLIALLAWVGLGADGLSSSCYGPEEAFKALGAHSVLALFVGLATVITIIIICASYSQIIELFPGGGGYLVASKLLSPSLATESAPTATKNTFSRGWIRLENNMPDIKKPHPHGWGFPAITPFHHRLFSITFRHVGLIDACAIEYSLLV